MQLIETHSNGLKREFKVVLPLEIISSKMNARLSEIHKTLRLPGFRLGKVPFKIVYKRYSSAVHADIIAASIQDSTTKIMEERNLRPALQPQIHILSGGNTETKEDLTFLIKVEVLPLIPFIDIKNLKLERLKVEVDDQPVEQVLTKLATDRQHSESVTENRPARVGDTVSVNIRGFFEDCEILSLAKENYVLKLGEENFIPGFDAALSGARVGEECHFTLVWPNGDLADKAIAFVVQVKELREVVPIPVDDRLAQSCGMESLDALRHVVWQQITQGYMVRSRAMLKRALFTRLVTDYTFDVPSGMLEAEFSAIWQQVAAARAKGEVSQEAMTKDEETLKKESWLIAERRVRLGLILAEIGRTHKITLTQTDVEQALSAGRKGGSPGMWQRIRGQSPSVLEALKVSLLEEKIVNFILATAPVTDRIVTAEELFQEPDDMAEGAARTLPFESKTEVSSSHERA